MVQQSNRGVGPLQTERRPAQLPTLTGIRGFAALGVFIFHVVVLVPFTDPELQSVVYRIFWQGGWAGVQLFFILSGFVLTWAWRPNGTTSSYFRRRFFKIYPNHLVTFVAAAIAFGWVANVAFNSKHAITSLLLIQSWFPQLEYRSSFNGPAWSLSCELLFYLSFPLLLRWVSRIQPKRLWAWAGGVVAAVFAVAVVAMLLPDGTDYGVVGLDDLEFWLIYQLPPVRMLEFVFGIILARIVMTGMRLPLGLRGSAVLAVAAIAVAPMFPHEFTVVAITIVPIGLLIAAIAKSDIAGRPNWLSSRFMVWSGDVSFAFYMWHYMVVLIGYQLLGGFSASVPVALAEIAMLFGITLLLAWLQYTRIEAPIMRRFASSRRVPTPVK